MEQELNVTKGNEHPEEWDKLLLTLEQIRDVVSKYYHECNEKNPPDIPLAMVIGERIAQAQLQNILAKLEEK